MEIRKTQDGIYEVTNPIVDFGKEIDDRYTQIKRKRLAGLLGSRRTIYVPNEDAPKPRTSRLVTAVGGALLLAGCATAKPGVEQLANDYDRLQDNKAKVQREYNQEAEKITDRTREEYDASLNARKGKESKEMSEALNAGADKTAKEVEKYTEDRQKALADKEKAEVMRDQRPSRIIIPSEAEKVPQKSIEKNSSLDISPYAFQRSQRTGEQESRVVNGAGVKVAYNFADGLLLYGKWEHDGVNKTETNSAGNLRLSSRADTYGAGIGYRLLDTPIGEFNLYGGLFNRTEANKIKGNVGMLAIDDKNKESILGLEAGLGYNFMLNENVGIGGRVAWEDYNAFGQNDLNAKTGVRFGVDITLRFGGKNKK